MLRDWVALAERAVAALERIAAVLEAAEPEWRRSEEVTSKEEILTRG